MSFYLSLKKPGLTIYLGKRAKVIKTMSKLDLGNKHEHLRKT